MPGFFRIDLAHSLPDLNRSMASCFFADFDFRGTVTLVTTIWLRYLRTATESLRTAEMSAGVAFLSFTTKMDFSLIKVKRFGLFFSPPLTDYGQRIDRL